MRKRLTVRQVFLKTARDVMESYHWKECDNPMFNSGLVIISGEGLYYRYDHTRPFWRTKAVGIHTFINAADLVFSDRTRPQCYYNDVCTNVVYRRKICYADPDSLQITKDFIKSYLPKGLSTDN